MQLVQSPLVQSPANSFHTRGNGESKEDRQKLAYAWYRRLAFPGKEAMQSIIWNAEDCDITSEDIDLLPWNKTETKVVNDDWIFLEDPPDDLFADTDFSESCSEVEHTTNAVASTTLPSLFLEKHESEKDQDQRRKKCYKWYKLLSKPTRETMCRIVEYTRGPDFTRQDIDLLRWNYEETAVVKNSKRKKRPAKHEKGSQHDKDTDFEVDFPDNLDNDNKDTKVEPEEHSSSHRMDETFHTCYQDGSRYVSEMDESEGEDLDRLEKGKSEGEEIDRLKGLLLRTNNLEEEHKRKKEGRLRKREAEEAAEKNKRAEEEHKRKRRERLRKREAAAAAEKNISKEATDEEAAKSKTMSGQDAEETAPAGIDNSEDARRQRAFRWYSQMCTTRTDFKRRVAALEKKESMDITSEDIDLLPWNETGSMVNIAKMNALTRANLMKLTKKRLA
jgi:hypothetical protein